MKQEERDLLDIERHLSEYDLSRWEKDILIEFNKSKDLDDLIELVKIEYLEQFFINLADGIKQYKHDRIEIVYVKK